MGGKSTKIKQRANKGAGRPRKEGERYPSGDIKRSETQKEVMSVVIEARRRIEGWSEKVTDDTVKSPFAGYTLGRVFLDGRITEEQRKAGDEYAEIISRYHRLTGIPFPSARAQSLFSVKGHDGEQSESVTTKARNASNAMMEVIGVLLRCDDGPQVRALVHNLVVMDYEHLRGMGEQQMLWVRRGLTALANRKQLPKQANQVIGWVNPQSKLSAGKKLIAAAVEAVEALRNTKPQDHRPQRLGWAPGGYIGLCRRCETHFIGDKRAIQCADCAYAP